MLSDANATHVTVKVGAVKANVTEVSNMRAFGTGLSMSVMFGISKPNVTDARSTQLMGITVNTSIQPRRIVLYTGMMLKTTTRPDNGAEINV